MPNTKNKPASGGAPGSGTATVAPARIFLQIDGDGPPDSTVPLEDRGEVTWCQDKTFSGDVEYIRADRVAKLLRALRQIKNWTDELDHHWGDTGYRAIDALSEYQNNGGETRV